MSGIVRAPAQVVEQVNSAPVENQESSIAHHNSTSDLPPTEYSKQGKPYLVKVLNIETIYSDLDQSQQSDAEFIDEHFEKLVNSGKYRNDEVGYKEFIKELEKKVDVKNAPLDSKLGKIAEFIKFTSRIQKYG